MALLILFAFIAGMVTILSPCILPILPIVLSGAIGGKRKPLGVIVGFMVSFSFFTLFLSSLVKIFGISPDVLRYLAIVVLSIAGVIFLVPPVQLFFEKLASKVANLAPTQKVRTGSEPPPGFWSGLLIGVSLGLLWTPCVGPILASVISLALTGTVTGTAVLIMLAFALGTAVPMFLIMYGGRQLLVRVPWLTAKLPLIQKIFAVIMIFVAVALALNWDRQFQSFILQKFPKYGASLTKFEDTERVKKELEKVTQTGQENVYPKPSESGSSLRYPSAPELIAGGSWFNLPEGKTALSLDELKGKVLLVDFWTYTCINCIRTLPYLRSWHEKYHDDGLVIIGVHTPEFEFEKNPKNVGKAIADFDLKYPVVQDNDYATWRAYGNRYWPAKYLVDAQGRVRYTHFGEGEYDETERMIQQLLSEAGGKKMTQSIENPLYEIYARTHETYLGYERMEFLESPEPVLRDKLTSYSSPKKLPKNRFAFDGGWTVGGEYAQPTASSKLTIHFDAQEVFLVMRLSAAPGSTATTAKVFLDGVAISADQSGEDVKNAVVTVDSDRLYKLVRLLKPGPHILTLEFVDNKTELFAFTFG